eukprot:TRINITY_DN20622_c0_g1_i1.p1 TRINITY_DN20622_c0_g1~~TRINITY_DN20622_c0_g1_i1.p1  ORF type:complete len:252 (-),score=69.90 TRINITY_DN20622_c0_g1_i1:406-1161(-)
MDKTQVIQDEIDFSDSADDDIQVPLAELTVLWKNQPPTTHSLFKGDNTIGRDDSNDISIVANSVSKNHAKITIDNLSDIFIEDLQSTNKTYLIPQNSQNLVLNKPKVLDPKKAYQLKDGQQIKFGDIDCTFTLKPIVESEIKKTEDGITAPTLAYEFEDDNKEEDKENNMATLAYDLDEDNKDEDIIATLAYEKDDEDFGATLAYDDCQSTNTNTKKDFDSTQLYSDDLILDSQPLTKPEKKKRKTHKKIF